MQFIFQLTKHIPNCSQPQQSGQTTIPFQAGHTDDTQTGAISSWQQLNLESPASIRTGFGGFFVGKKDGRLRRILDAWLVDLIARCSSKVSICTPKKSWSTSICPCVHRTWTLPAVYYQKHKPPPVCRTCLTVSTDSWWKMICQITLPWNMISRLRISD